MKLNKSIILAGLLVANIASAASLEDRVSELEAQQSLNIFSFSGYLWNRWDGVTTKPEGADEETFNNLRMGFGLNINANISNRLKFYSRLGVRKYYNLWTGPNGKYTREFGGLDAGADGSVSSTVYLDKAYFDYSMSENFVLSMGRLPTVDGTPAHLWDAQARMGTYPMLSYNSILDGIAFTYKLDRFMPEGHKLALRFIQTPFSSVAYTDSKYPNEVGQDHTTNANGNLPSLTAVNTLHVDYNMPKNIVSDATNIIWQSWRAKFRFPNAWFTGGQTSSLAVDWGVSTLSMEFNGLMGTGLDLAVNSVSSSITSTGAAGVLAGVCNTHKFGFGTDDCTEGTTKGTMTSISARYKIMSKTYLGLDSVSATKGFFYYDAAGVEITDWFITPGTATHVYVTHKLEDNLTLRVGNTVQQSKYDSMTTGAIGEDKTKITTNYVQLRLDF